MPVNKQNVYLAHISAFSSISSLKSEMRYLNSIYSMNDTFAYLEIQYDAWLTVFYNYAISYRDCFMCSCI